MPASHVQDLLALFRRESSPDIPSSQRKTDGPEASGEACPHGTILAQALAVVPFVLVFPVLLVLVLVVAVAFVALGLRGRFRRRRRRRRRHHGRGCLHGFCGLTRLRGLVVPLGLPLALVGTGRRLARGRRRDGSRRGVAGERARFGHGRRRWRRLGSGPRGGSRLARRTGTPTGSRSARRGGGTHDRTPVLDSPCVHGTRRRGCNQLHGALEG